MPDALKELQSMLSRSFDIALPGLVSREQILAALSARIEQLIAGNPDQLFSMLYRLDIAEQKIKQAMNMPGSVSYKIAILIYERQMEKIISRKRFGSERPDEDLAW